MKRFFSFLAMSAIVLGMASCGGNEPASPFVINPNSENGMMPGRFTVDSKGTQVRFSQGNLQYNDSLKLWRFATNEWDTLGIANKQIGNEDYDGWIDLFGWSTGENPTLASTEHSDYTEPFKDWGENAIANGGNQTSQWHTLSNDEWVYIFHGRDNAEKLFGLGTVAGINGLILLPDEWEMPWGVPGFKPSTTKGMAWDSEKGRYDNSNEDNFEHNTYTAEQWDVLEKAGAIFLPTASYRSGTDVAILANEGNYWSSKPQGSAMAFYVYIGASIVNPQSGTNRHCGFSVRLVR